MGFDFRDFEKFSLDTLNAEQKLAVENILAARNVPLPYLVFGPPGTGKTKTLCAAIEIIVKTTNNNVLMCANSNSVCDEITERLMNVLEPADILRLYTKTYNPTKLKPLIKPVSNFSKNAF